MKSLFSQSDQVFPQFLVFEAIFEACGNFFLVLKTLFGPFIVLKTNVSVPWFRCKIVYKTGHPGPRYLRKTKWGCGLVWRAMFKNIFANISAHVGPIFKPIFALKPWDGDGRFEYNKRYKRTKKCQEICSLTLNIASKTQNCGKTRPNWAKWPFIRVSVTPYRMESGEIFQTASPFFILFPSVSNIITLDPF